MNGKIIIPRIDFEFWALQWSLNIGYSHVYSNLRLNHYNDFVGTLDECEIRIMEIVNYSNLIDSEIYTVIDLINKWGGRSSRMFYVPNRKTGKTPRENVDIIQYKKAINLAFRKDFKAFIEFQKIIGIGPSFAGKHAMFWSKGDLIVLDNKISGTLGFKTPTDILAEYSYSDILIEFGKTKDLVGFSNNTEIERALFAFHSNYFDNANSKFKITPPIDLDFDIAKGIAQTLKIM